MVLEKECQQNSEINLFRIHHTKPLMRPNVNIVNVKRYESGTVLLLSQRINNVTLSFVY